MRDGLTPKQKAFADYYIETGNASESARRAGYKCAEQQGKENLQKPTIIAYIAERTKPTEDKRIATAEDVMVFLTRMMNGEIKDAFGLDASNADRISAAREIMKRHNVVGDNNKDALDRLDNVLEQIGGVV